MTDPLPPVPSGEFLLYTSEDGQTRIQLRAQDGSVWLSQADIAALFATSIPNVSIHIRNILKDGELVADSVVKESLITAADGKTYKTKLYRLELILAVGYRVRSPRGTQFRQWATGHLAEYLVKGFVLDDQRLKNPGGWDHFDELLARIREIRASEKRFYQKVRDLFALSTDYRDNDQASALFFAETQNKLLFAVTSQTAAELVVARSDPNKPNMALQSFEGARVRKHDVVIAKNYLTLDEVDSLNRLAVIFLEQAELRVKERKQLTLEYWRENVDRLLTFNDRQILKGAGQISHDAMTAIAHERFDTFDTRRRTQAALDADAEDLQEIEAVAKIRP